ncbi:MAG: hypothetical protein ACI4U2_00410, partial [Christensenellaceae bacterium]
MKRLFSILCFLFCALIPLLAFLPAKEEEEEGETVILRLWNIDTFEGGVGSRASFLGRVADSFERERSVYLMVTSHTRESAEAAFLKGEVPDLVSCGVGLNGLSTLVKPWKGEYAHGWCMGKYCLYAREGDFSDVTNLNTIVSQSGMALSEVAARFAGLEGTLTVEPSLTAYVDFLSGKAKYLLGTQRDLWRFRTKKVSVVSKRIDGFSDLIQFIFITTKDDELLPLCGAFVDHLLSDEVQRRVKAVGLYS